MLSRWTILWMLVLASLALTSLTGCPPRTAQNHIGQERVPANKEQTPAVTDTANATTVKVNLTEMKITMQPDPAPAGNIVFTISNTGHRVHAIIIKGQGIDEHIPNLQPGERAILRIDNMRPGAYAVYCPVDNHAELGMRMTFKVK